MNTCPDESLPYGRNQGGTAELPSLCGAGVFVFLKNGSAERGYYESGDQFRVLLRRLSSNFQ
jgi:hypothetical protein